MSGLRPPAGTRHPAPGSVPAATIRRRLAAKAGAVARFLVAAVTIAAAATPAAAQVAPSPGQLARHGALLAAAHRGDLTALDAALAKRADLDLRDEQGRSAVHVAAFARQREVLRRLAAAGADLGALENDRYDAVTIAAVADDEETLRTLLALGASAKLITSRYDGTALIAAAHLGHDGIVRQLIAAGAPLDHVNNLHWTAVIEAVVLGDGGPRHQASLRALLEAGASPNLSDRSGRTPLALASGRGYAAMVKLLQQRGAKP